MKHTRSISIFLFILKALVDSKRVDWLWSACVFPQENGEKLARSSSAAPAIFCFVVFRELPPYVPGEGGPCWQTAFSPDGNLLVTRHELGMLDIWRVPSWAEIAAVEAKEKSVK